MLAPTSGLCAVLEENTAVNGLPDQLVEATSCPWAPLASGGMPGSLSPAILTLLPTPSLPQKSKLEVTSLLGSKELRAAGSPRRASDGTQGHGGQMKEHRGKKAAPGSGSLAGLQPHSR